MMTDIQGQMLEGPSNVLVINNSDNSHWPLENYDSITAEDTRIANLLSVTVSEPVQSHYEILQRHLDQPSPSIDVITVDEQTRSAASPASSFPLLGSNDNDGWITTVSPFNLTQLGITIHTYLHEGTEDTSETALFVDSVSQLLHQTDLQTTFRFLHILTGEITASGAVGYYQIDGSHDQQTLATLFPLFDAVVEVTEPVTDSGERHSRTETGITAPSGRASTQTHSYLDRLSELTPWLWLIAIATFGFGDIFTTFIGLQTGIAVEASPVAARVINANGLGFIYIVKITIFGLFYLLWRVTPPPQRIGVPLGLSLLGISITVWNLSMLIGSAIFR